MAGRKKTKERRNKQSAVMETPEFWERCFLSIGVEGISLSEFCRIEDVNYNAVSYQLKSDLDLQDRYASAQENRGHIHAERIAELSELVLSDDPKKANQYKISLDSKRWLASVMNRKAYGQQIEQNVSVDINLNSTYLNQLKNLMTNKPEISDQSKKQCETIEHQA